MAALPGWSVEEEEEGGIERKYLECMIVAGILSTTICCQRDSDDALLITKAQQNILRFTAISIMCAKKIKNQGRVLCAPRYKYLLVPIHTDIFKSLKHRSLLWLSNSEHTGASCEGSNNLGQMVQHCHGKLKVIQTQWVCSAKKK